MSNSTEVSASPEALQSDDNGLYLPPSWQGLKQQVTYLAQFGSSIQVIHGDKGAGKTTLFRLLEEEGICADYLAVRVKATVDTDAFFRDILWQLGLRPGDDDPFGTLIVALRGYVQSLQQERARVVLAIDDAHLLTDAFLAAVASVLQGREDTGVGLHLILFAETGLAERFDALQLLDVEVHDVQIPTFNATEVEQFLYAKGLGLNPPASPEALRQLWHNSKGIPGEILRLYAKLRRSKPDVSLDMETSISLNGLPLAHMAALLLLTGALIWAFLVRDPQTLPAPGADQRSEPEVGPRSSSVASLGSEQNEQMVAQTRSVALLSEAAMQSMASEGQQKLVVTSEGAASSQPLLDAEAAVTKVAGAATEALSLNTAQSDASIEDGADFDVKVINSDRLAASASVQPLAESSTAAKSSQAAISASTQSQVVASGKSNRLASTQDEWLKSSKRALLNYSGNAFVLQLMATGALDRLYEFAMAQPNRGNLLVYPALRNGQKLFILVEGFYADKESALAGRANLPAGQQRGGPWPKRIASIHEDIAEVR